MATLTPLIPASGTPTTTDTYYDYTRSSANNWTQGSAQTTNIYSYIDETVGTIANGDTAISHAPGDGTTGYFQVPLSDTDALFESMDTLSINFDAETTGTYDDDTGYLRAQVFNGATSYTNEVVLVNYNGSSYTVGSASVANGTQAFTLTASGLSATKAQWDAAQLRITTSDGKTKGSDVAAILLVDCRLTGTYTPATTDYTETVTDAIGITDTTAPVKSITVAATDAVGITDTTAPVKSIAVTATDAIGITDTAVGVRSDRAYTETITGAVGITDTVETQLTSQKVDVPTRYNSSTARTITAALAQDQWGKYLVPQVPWINPVERGFVGITDSTIGASFSPDGRFLATAANSVAKLWQVRSGSFVLESTSTGVSVLGRFAAWSPDGRFLANASGVTRFKRIWERSGATLNELSAAITSNDGGIPQDAAWSPDGRFVAFAGSSSPYVTVYEREGTTFTQLADPATVPTGGAEGVSWSPDGRFLAVAHSTSPSISIYERTGTTLTKLTNPGTLPAGNGYGCAFSPDGRFLAVGTSAGSPYYLTVYEREGTTFTALTISGAGSRADGQVAFSPSGILALGGSNEALFYRYDAGVFRKFYTLPFSGDLGNIAWSPDGRFFACSVANSLKVYETSGLNPREGYLWMLDPGER